MVLKSNQMDNELVNKGSSINYYDPNGRKYGRKCGKLNDIIHQTPDLSLQNFSFATKFLYIGPPHELYRLARPTLTMSTKKLGKQSIFAIFLYV